MFDRTPVPTPFVPGVRLSRDMKTLLLGTEGIRTFMLPKTVKKTKKEVFVERKALKSVVVNPGLELLGVNAFYGCGLKDMWLPGTLRTIEK